MTTTAKCSATVPRSCFDGQVLSPGTREYDSARSVWNAMIDHRPKLIVQCASIGDVVTAVRTARERGLEIGVRCGGHNIAGLAVPRGGLMIDLTAMGRVTVDPVTRRARLQGWITGQQRGGYRPERVEVPQPHAAISSGDRSYRTPSLGVISNPPEECLT